MFFKNQIVVSKNKKDTVDIFKYPNNLVKIELPPGHSAIDIKEFCTHYNWRQAHHVFDLYFRCRPFMNSGELVLRSGGKERIKNAGDLQSWPLKNNKEMAVVRPSCME